MSVALIKEVNKQYLEATECYEDEINNNLYASVDNYINLAFIYWSFAFDFFGFFIPNNIPEDYSIIGGNRYQKILELGLKKYPNNVELHFWERYFSHIIFGEEFSDSDCLHLIKKYGEQNYVPYFFLYLLNEIQYKKQRDELMKEIEKMATAKNIYIKSILSSGIINS